MAKIASLGAVPGGEFRRIARWMAADWVAVTQSRVTLGWGGRAAVVPRFFVVLTSSLRVRCRVPFPPWVGRATSGVRGF